MDSSRCEAPDVCGNGTTETGEGCDDGNLLSGDGCNPTCALEEGQPCTMDWECEGSCVINVCTSMSDTCSDGAQNGMETGIDCGLLCPRTCVVYDCEFGQAEIPIGECAALKMLYDALNGPTWTTTGDWFSNNQPCSWTGITCQTGRVTEITVTDDAIDGSLPRPLFANLLPELTALRLRHTMVGQTIAIRGSIPDSFGSFAKLEILLIPSAMLTGTIPLTFDQLTFSGLDLSSNQLSGTFPEHLQFKGMALLKLNDNLLSGPISSMIGNWTTLFWLDLGDNAFSGTVPTSITNLTPTNILYLCGQSGMLSASKQTGMFLRSRMMHDWPLNDNC